MTAKLDKMILFSVTAGFAVLTLYIGLHDIAHVCRSTIVVDASEAAAALAVAWTVVTARQVIKD